jgi:hypothetical protein
MTQSKSENRLSVLANKVETASTQSATNSGNTHSLEPASRDYMKGTRWEAMDNQIDQNLGSAFDRTFYPCTSTRFLDDMSSQLARLRAYGKAMGEEVDDQNKLLDRIENKTGRNNDVIRSQDNQMRKFLK